MSDYFDAYGNGLATGYEEGRADLRDSIILILATAATPTDALNEIKSLLHIL